MISNAAKIFADSYFRQTYMCQNHRDIENEKMLLSSLVIEISDLLFKLRKADKIISREIAQLKQRDEIEQFKKIYVAPLNEEKLRKIIGQIPSRHLLIDEHITYMLENSKNSIFNLMSRYNEYLNCRNNEQEAHNWNALMNLDEKLAYYIRRLGAMIYHFNIHVSMLTIWPTNASLSTDKEYSMMRERARIS